VQLFELANEYGMTSEAAAALCGQLGLGAHAGGDVMSEGDVARFRNAAGPPPRPASSPNPFAPAPMPVDPTTEAPGFAAPSAPFAPPAAPAAGPAPTSYGAPPAASYGAPAAPFAPQPGAAPAWGQPGQPAPGYGQPPYPQQPYGQPGYGQAPNGQLSYGPSGTQMGSPDDVAKLASARKAATGAIQQGILWVVGSIVAMIAILAATGGAFGLLLFGPVIFGVRRIMAGQKLLARVRQAERQLGIRH
jgi:hypothetical protein